MLAHVVTFNATKRPSVSVPSSTIVQLSRPCASERKLSLRSAVQRTARPRRRAAHYGGLLRIKEDLHAERAADVAGDHAQLLAAGLHYRIGNLAVEVVRALAGRVERRSPARRVVLGERRARLDRVRHQAVVPELEPRHARPSRALRRPSPSHRQGRSRMPPRLFARRLPPAAARSPPALFRPRPLPAKASRRSPSPPDRRRAAPFRARAPAAVSPLGPAPESSTECRPARPPPHPSL